MPNFIIKLCKLAVNLAQFLNSFHRHCEKLAPLAFPKLEDCCCCCWDWLCCSARPPNEAIPPPPLEGREKKSQIIMIFCFSVMISIRDLQ